MSARASSVFIVSMSFLVLRKNEPNMRRPYKVQHYKIVGIIASIMSGIMVLMYLIPKSGCTLTIQEWIIVGGWIVLGVVFYCFCRNKYKDDFGKVKVE